VIKPNTRHWDPAPARSRSRLARLDASLKHCVLEKAVTCDGGGGCSGCGAAAARKGRKLKRDPTPRSFSPAMVAAFRDPKPNRLFAMWAICHGEN